MPYVTPSTVVAGQTYSAAAHNVIVNDVIDLDSRLRVVTSSTRPGSPTEGMFIYETDTQKTLIYNGSSWVEVSDLDNVGGLSDAAYSALPRGFITSATLSSFSTTSTSYVDTGLAVTFTAEANRRYLVTLQYATTNNGNFVNQVVINDGSADLSEGYSVQTANVIITSSIFAVVTPAAGSRTYKTRMKVAGGTGELYGSSTRASLQSRMLVMDIGAA